MIIENKKKYGKKNFEIFPMLFNWNMNATRNESNSMPTTPGATSR